MVFGNEPPLETFLNSLHAVLSPLESGISRATAKHFHIWEEQLLFFSHQFKATSKKKRKKKKNHNNGGGADDYYFGDNAKERNKGSSPSSSSSYSFCVRVPQLKSSFLGTSSSQSSICKENAMETEGTHVNCLQFAVVTWSLMFQGFLQAFSNPFKAWNKPNLLHKQKHPKCHSSPIQHHVNHYPQYLELILGFVFDHLIQNHFQKLDKPARNDPPSSAPQFNHLGVIKGILKGKQADVDFFIGNLGFAKMGFGGASSPSLVQDDEEVKENAPPLSSKEESEATSTAATTSPAQKIANDLLNIPLSNVERLRSTFSGVSLTELIELVPNLGRPSNERDYPDKKKLFSVHDFFRYTESEGRRFFEELDRDGDGQVTLEDLEIAMRRRRLPRRYAREFMRRTRSHLLSKSFGWKQFLTLMEQKEPTILRAYTTLCLSKSGTLQKSQIVTSLKNAGLPANEDNAVAMMRFLNADTEGSISYGHFRNFMLLLPSDRLEDDPRSIWFEAATVVAVPPPVEIPAGSVLKSALAGGLASALSTSLLYPVDTLKTRLQASTLSFPELLSKLPQIGVEGLYRGSIPAILGQFSSHGLRTGIFEASKLVLINVAPNLPEIQVQSISSFCSTFLGTAVRIPCEVLKQRLQAGIFDNVGEAIVGTLQQDGLKGFFRGTGATLCREVPFYVAGMGLYAESKKATQQLLNRELEVWETIAVGALSGGLAAVVTTPFDVMKTRMMTAPQGLPVSMSIVALSILHQEGPLGLFKGAIPRFFWIAPLGAMNFAGYELARKAMLDNNNNKTTT